MTTNSKEGNISAILRELNELKMHELRSRASKGYNIRVTTDMLKKDIISLIKEKLMASDYATPVTDESVGPKPGWARITLPFIQGASRSPLPCSVNGYMCHIPRNQIVDVPIKIVDALRDCKTLALVRDEGDGENSTPDWEASPRFPVVIHAINDGPDPRPGHEATKDRLLAPFRAYFEKFQRWPKPRELRAAVEAGLMGDWSKSKAAAVSGL